MSFGIRFILPIYIADIACYSDLRWFFEKIILFVRNFLSTVGTIYCYINSVSLFIGKYLLTSTVNTMKCCILQPFSIFHFCLFSANRTFYLVTSSIIISRLLVSFCSLTFHTFITDSFVYCYSFSVDVALYCIQEFFCVGISSCKIMMIRIQYKFWYNSATNF